MDDNCLLPIENKGRCSPDKWFVPRRTEEEAAREQAIRDWVGNDRAPAVFANFHPASKHVADVVDDILAKLQAETKNPLDGLRGAWTKTVGGEIAKICSPYSLYNGLLTIRVDNPSWKFVLERQHKKALLDKLHKLHPDIQIDDLKFMLAG